MRDCAKHGFAEFDVLLCADNSVTHLEGPSEISQAGKPSMAVCGLVTQWLAQGLRPSQNFLEAYPCHQRQRTNER